MYQTQRFSLPSGRQLRWYFSGSGNLIVDIDSESLPTATPGVRGLTSFDSGDECVHQGGRFDLDVDSECARSM